MTMAKKTVRIILQLIIKINSILIMNLSAGRIQMISLDKTSSMDTLMLFQHLPMGILQEYILIIYRLLIRYDPSLIKAKNQRIISTLKSLRQLLHNRTRSISRNLQLIKILPSLRITYDKYHQISLLRSQAEITS